MTKKPVKKFFEEVREDLKDKSAIKNSLKFLVVFSVCFLVILYVIIPSTTGFWDSLGIFHAQLSSNLVGSFGIESAVSENTLTTQISGKFVDFEITRLCSGDIEIALLVALLLASFDVLLIWRVLGIVLGAIFLMIVNPFRIAITILITQNLGMETGDFYHGVIFRLFLFVLLVLYYFAWYRFFVNRKSKTYEKICKKIRAFGTVDPQ